MIVRGLALAITVGAVSAVALGLVVMNYGETRITGVNGLLLSIAEDRADYKIGEHISATLHNNGIMGIEFDDTSYYGLRVAQLDGITVYSPAANGTRHVLGPGESVDIVWDQSKHDGEQAYSGTYRILSEGVLLDGKQARDSVIVNIRR